jgi:hypothetical protein
MISRMRRLVRVAMQASPQCIASGSRYGSIIGMEAPRGGPRGSLVLVYRAFRQLPTALDNNNPSQVK